MKQFGVKVIIHEPGFYQTTLTDTTRNVEMFRKIWDRAPNQIREEYGEEFYNFSEQQVVKSLSRCSPEIEDVVEAYFHSLTSRFPRKRYHIGMDSIFFYIPFSMLPTQLQDLFFESVALCQKIPTLKCLMK